MVSQRVRLRYSTIVNYASLVYRVAVALGFAVIVARRLSVAEFGLWGIILSLAAMLVAPTRLWVFWSQRFHARGWREAAGTGLGVTLIYLAPAALLYLLASVVEDRVIGWGFQYLVLALPIALLQPLYAYLSSVVAVTKPELGAYASIINDTLKLAVAYVLVAIFKMGLSGAIAALSLSILTAALYLTASLVKLGALTPSFSLSLAKKWFRAAYIPSLLLLINLLRSSLRAAVSLATGSEVPVAYLNVGFSAEAPLLQASRASVPALYARSLRKKRSEDLEETLRLYLLFAGFLLATFASLSIPIASLYNPQYIVAHVVIPLVAVYALLSGFSNIYSMALSGAEEADASGKLSRETLLSSMLFKVPLARLATLSSSYLIFIALLMLFPGGPLEEALIVVASLAAGSAALIAYLWFRARTFFPHNFPLREALAFTASALLAAAYYVASGAANLEVVSFWRQAPLLLAHLLAGLAVYAAAAYTFSPWTRKLVRDAISYLGKTMPLINVIRKERIR